MTNMFKAFMAFQMFKKKKDEEEKEERETQLDNERVAMQNHLEVTLASKIRRLQNLYNRISVESGYREQVMDNTYMVICGITALESLYFAKVFRIICRRENERHDSIHKRLL